MIEKKIDTFVHNDSQNTIEKYESKSSIIIFEDF